MLDIEAIIKTVGLLGVWGIVFAESGLLIGFFLPGDSLLFTAGFLASQGYIDITILSIGAFIAAVAGDNVGYSFGHRVGKRLFHRTDSIFFHKDHLLKAQAFYQKHGKKTIILARFVPIVRTFAPIVAGMGDMEYKTFFVFNLIGGLLWAVGLTVLGYVLGNSVPAVKEHIDAIVILIVIVSIAPSAYHVLKERSARDQIFKFIRDYFKKFIKM